MAKSVIIVSCHPWCSGIHQQHNTFGDKRLTQNGPRKELAVELLRAQVEARGAEKARQVAINAARNGWSTQEVLTAVNIASAHILQQTNPKPSPIDSSPLYPELIAL